MARATTLLLLVAACRVTTSKVVQPYSAPDARPEPVVPGYLPAYGYKLTESDLATITICADTLGVNTADRIGGRCLPCLPIGTFATGNGARRHASRLWQHIGRAPHDRTYPGSVCTDIAYHLARVEAPEDPTVVVEATLFRVASANDSLRAFGLERLDGVVDSLLVRGDSAEAGRLVELFARGLWERAQRMLERPTSIELNDWERDAHDLTDGAPALRALPPIPRTSARIGISEAEWSARLFDLASGLLRTDAERARARRLALAPWVTLARWKSLDSAAASMLQRAPNDSVALPARALAAYHAITNVVSEQPGVWARFDSALRAMPRVDSARHDSFDGMLSAADDEWRFGFLPSQLVTLDRRGWLTLDPLWSTPINELHLARRARVAEADIRFADLARTGESGSETVPGTVWIRQGRIAPTLVATRHLFDWMLSRDWGRDRVQLQIAGANDIWRSFYTGHFAPQKLVRWPGSEGCPSPGGPVSFLECTRLRRSDWNGVAFWGQTDTIDVALARFRARSDSVDVYIGARLPLRNVRHRDDLRARKEDRVALGVWITTPLGAPLYHVSELRPLPREDEIAWLAQWRPRIGSGDVMHRVEALEPSRPSGARGAVLHTNDAQVVFPLRGFGMSDVLLARSAQSRRGGAARRWSDLELTPNGSVIAPRESFAMAWEIYDLATAADGLMHWHVSVRRERGRRESRDDMRSTLRGDRTANDKVIVDDTEVPALEFTRVAPPSAVAVENIRFNLNDVPAGRHVLVVRIEDLTSKRVVTRSVTVRVLGAQAQARARTISPESVQRSRGAQR